MGEIGKRSPNKPKRDSEAKTLRKCSCQPRSSKVFSKYLKRVHIFLQRQCDHEQSCQFYQISRSLNTIGAEFSYYGNLMVTSLQASITSCRGAGGFSISPTLSIGWTVSYDHPVCKLLQVDRSTSYEEKYARPAGGRDKVLEFVKREIDVMFRSGRASPLDKTVNGEDYLQVSRSLLLAFFWTNVTS